MDLYISPYIFFLVQESKIILWNYETHLQYELSEDEFHLLKNYKTHLESSKLKEFVSANILSHEPYEEIDWAWDELSKIFFVGTRNVIPINTDTVLNFASSYIQGCQEIDIEVKSPDIKNLITLPTPDLKRVEDKKYIEILKLRMTSRVFKETSFVTLDDFSVFLFLTFGYIHGDWKEFLEKGFEQSAFRKASPSAGGLYHCEAYIFIYNISDIESGIYKYIPEEHGLTRCSDIISQKELIEILSGQFFIKNICFGIFLTANFEKLMKKYHHSEALRSAYVDVGALVQTAQLNSTALGLENFITGVFHEESICKILKITDIKKTPLFFVGVGYGQRQAIPDEFLKVAYEIECE